MPAVPFKFTKDTDAKKEEEKDKTLRTNRDRLYYDERQGEQYDLIFSSTMVREWMKVVKEKYPEFQEIKDDNGVRLKSKDKKGTITFHPFVKVLVHGQTLRDEFDRDFREMRQKVLEARDAQDEVNNDNLEGAIKGLKLDD